VASDSFSESAIMTDTGYEVEEALAFIEQVALDEISHKTFTGYNMFQSHDIRSRTPTETTMKSMMSFYG
jgi:hypothetical protein